MCLLLHAEYLFRSDLAPLSAVRERSADAVFGQGGTATAAGLLTYLPWKPIILSFREVGTPAVRAFLSASVAEHFRLRALS